MDAFLRLVFLLTTTLLNKALGTAATGTPSLGTPSLGTPSLGTPSLGIPATGTPLATPRVLTIVRHHEGDYYILRDNSSSCRCLGGGATSSEGGEGTCHCHCPLRRPLLRDDTLTCEEDVAECLLAEFVGPGGAERVPHVYLPVEGQIVHPRAEVALLGLESPGGSLVSPVCVVTGAQRLTAVGWRYLPNTTHYEPPFRLHRREGRTFLRWVGGTSSDQLSGRLVLVSLLCRDATKQHLPHFRPCVAFRASGSVMAGAFPPHKEPSSASHTAWVVGGASLGGALLLYLAVIVWILRRRRARRASRERNLAKRILDSDASSDNKSSKPTRHRSTRGPSTPPSAGRGSDQQNDQQCQQETQQSDQLPGQQHGSSLLSERDLSVQEQLEDLSSLSSRHFAQQSSATSLTASVDVQCRLSGHSVGDAVPHDLDTYGSNQRVSPQQPFYLGTDHGAAGGGDWGVPGGRCDGAASEHGAGAAGEDHDELEEVTAPPEVGTNVRKKLYFNPSYFEPEMLQEPPPAALDFLDKIREIISSAKSKLRTRSFQPSLNDIPEDDYTYYSQSRPHSRSTARATPSCRSRVSFKMGFSSKDEVEDLTKGRKQTYDTVVSSDPKDCGRVDDSFAADSLDETDDGGSRSSTLKRMAARVNERGTSLVSEIIKNLDRKNRNVPSNFTSSLSKFQQGKIDPMKVHHLVKVDSYHNSNSDRPMFILRSEVDDGTLPGGACDERHPDLIKPSVLRSVLRDGRRKTDSSNTFENFCQEMIATFNRIKKYGETITPASTISKKKTRNSSNNQINNVNESEDGDGKVRQWLQGLDNEGLYTDQVRDNSHCDNNAASVTYDCTSAGEPISFPSCSIISARPQTTARRKTDQIEISNIEHETIEYEAACKRTPLKESEKRDSISGVLPHGVTSDPNEVEFENTYEEIKLPRNNRQCSISTTADVAVDTAVDCQIPRLNKGLLIKSTATAFQEIEEPVQNEDFEDELNTSFDQDTLERQPKRRSNRSRSILTDQNSDYCVTDSDDLYDESSYMSMQSIIEIQSSQNSEEQKDSEMTGQIPQRNLQRVNLCSDNKLKAGNSVLPSFTSSHKPPLPPKQCCSPETRSVAPPCRPPKSKSRSESPEHRPPLPAKDPRLSESQHVAAEPPALPKKRRKPSDEFALKSDSKIPELSDEAAAAILLGLQAHKSPLAMFFSHSNDDTDVDCRTAHLHRSNSCTAVRTRSDFPQRNKLRQSFKGTILMKKTVELTNSGCISSSVGGDERVRGQFILAPEGKSPASRRSSLSRSGQSTSSRSSSCNTDTSCKNVKLCNCAKNELEKHFIEKGKPDADTIKKTWRRILKKSDDSLNGKTLNESALPNINEEKEVGKCKKCTKHKQEDSGYQSSDSSSSSKSHTSYYDESSCSIDLDGTDDSLPTKSSTFGPQIFPKSQSLQHLQGVPVQDVYQSFDGSRCSSRSSLNNDSVKSVHSYLRHDGKDGGTLLTR